MLVVCLKAKGTSDEDDLEFEENSESGEGNEEVRLGQRTTSVVLTKGGRVVNRPGRFIEVGTFLFPISSPLICCTRNAK